MQKRWFWGIGLAFIFVLGSLTALPLLANDNFHTFKLNPFELDGGLKIPDRLCFSKVSNIATVGGEKFDSDQSPFFVDNPSLEFFASDNVNVIDGFIIEPKLKCLSGVGSSIQPDKPASQLTDAELQELNDMVDEKLQACKTDPEGTNCDATNLDVLVIDSADLSVQVISEDLVLDKKITTYTETITTKQVEVHDGEEVTLASFKISVPDLEDDLSSGQYASWQEFRVFGTLTMHPKICDACVFTYSIPEDAIPTYHRITVAIPQDTEKPQDDNNDGIPDENKSGKQNDALAEEEANRNADSASSETLGDITEFGDCLILGDTECLNQPKFSLIVFGIIGIFGLVVLGILWSIINRGGMQR